MNSFYNSLEKKLASRALGGFFANGLFQKKSNLGGGREGVEDIFF